MIRTIPFAPWAPDRASFGGEQSTVAQGVIPSASGYRPFPSWALESAADVFPGICRGAISFYDTEGNPMTLGGTDDGLFVLRAGAWEEIGSGYSGALPGWDFARYGNTIIAVNGRDAPQYAAIGVSSISDFQAIPGAPVASSVEVVKEFVMLGGVEKTKVRWSAIGAPLDWPTPGSNDAQYKQSDEQDFPDTGSLVGVAGGMTGMDLVIFTERAIFRGQYVGTPYIFQFDILDKGRGCIAPRSVLTGSNAIYFLSEEGFFVTNGSSLKNIGFERVNLWFRQISDDTRRHEVRGVVDPVRDLAIWTFPSVAAPEGVHDYILAYHTQLDQWSYAKAQTAVVFNGLSLERPLDTLDSVGPLDSLPFSLDAVVWKGGVPSLAAFSSSNHLGWFSGPAMAAIIETAEAGGSRMMVHGVRPIIDGAAAGVSLYWRDFLSQIPTETQCAPVSAFDGVNYTHQSARYARARIKIPAGASWTFAQGCDLIIEEEGTL